MKSSAPPASPKKRARGSFLFFLTEKVELLFISHVTLVLYFISLFYFFFSAEQLVRFITPHLPPACVPPES